MYNENVKNIFEKGKNYLKIEKEYRTIDIINSISKLCKLLKPFMIYLDEKNKNTLEDILYKFSSNLEYREMKCGTFINKFGEDDQMFYIILKGIIGKFSIKYSKYFLSLTNYCLHLIKLQLLKETYLINECYEYNKDIITIPRDIISVLKENKKIDYLNEINKLKSKINHYKSYKNYQLSDFEKLYNVQIITIQDKEPLYQLMIPEYEFIEYLGFGNKIGLLTIPRHIKSLNAYVNLTHSEIGCLEKNNIQDPKFWKNIHLEKKYWLETLMPSFFIFEGIKMDFIKKNFIPYFQHMKVKKGEYIIKRKTPHYGIFFVIKGYFQIKTIVNYDELNEIIYNLIHSLDEFPNYKSDIKSNEKFLNENKNTLNNSVFNSRDFLEKNKEKNEILMSEVNSLQILGLNDFLEYKTKLNLFSVICYSDEADVFFVPTTIESIILNSIDSIRMKAAKLIEQRAKYFIKTLVVYKQNYFKEFEVFKKKYIFESNTVKFPTLNYNHSSNNILSYSQNNFNRLYLSPRNKTIRRTNSSLNLGKTNYKIKKRIKEVMDYYKSLTNKNKTKKNLKDYFLNNKLDKNKKDLFSFNIFSPNKTMLKIKKIPLDFHKKENENEKENMKIKSFNVL